MSVRGNRPLAAPGGSPLDRSMSVQSVFDTLNARIRALESGRGNGPGGSFGLPFSFVDGATGTQWQFSVNNAGRLTCTNLTTGEGRVVCAAPDQISLSADTPVRVAPAVLPGLDKVYQFAAGEIVTVVAVVDAASSDIVGGLALATFTVDGIAQPHPVTFRGYNGTEVRATVTQEWVWVAPADGMFRLSLVASSIDWTYFTATDLSVYFFAAGTTMTVSVS